MLIRLCGIVLSVNFYSDVGVGLSSWLNPPTSQYPAPSSMSTPIPVHRHISITLPCHHSRSAVGGGKTLPNPALYFPSNDSQTARHAPKWHNGELSHTSRIWTAAPRRHETLDVVVNEGLSRVAMHTRAILKKLRRVCHRMGYGENTLLLQRGLCCAFTNVAYDG
jgi:hypothetical protein